MKSKPIGEGSLAKVYKAKHVKWQFPMAYKQYNRNPILLNHNKDSDDEDDDETRCEKKREEETCVSMCIIGFIVST